jgi:aspartokinase-like uncharacterized kinase
MSFNLFHRAKIWMNHLEHRAGDQVFDSEDWESILDEHAVFTYFNGLDDLAPNIEIKFAESTPIVSAGHVKKVYLTMMEGKHTMYRNVLGGSAPIWMIAFD